MNGETFPRNHFRVKVHQVEPFGVLQPHSKLTKVYFTGAMILEIKTLSPVHVGSGTFGLEDAGPGLMKEIVRRKGTPIIPGSSIKGAIRQIHEVLTQSADPFGKDQEERPRIGATTSRSTALFGGLGYQGRVSFDDAVPGAGQEIEVERFKLSVAYPPDEKTGRRFYGRLPRGAFQPKTIQAEAIPAGCSLETTLRFRNLQLEELGSLLLALGLERFTPRIGGDKYDDAGWVRIRVVRYRRREQLGVGPPSWHEGNEVEGFIRSCLEQFNLRGAGARALREFEEKLQAPNGGRTS